MIADVVKKYNIDTIYNLAALLSVVAEKKPQLAWKIGIDGLWNIFDKILDECRVVTTPGSGFGEAGEGFLRFSSFGHHEAVNEACARLSALKL